MSKILPKTKCWSIIGAGIHTMKSPNQIDRQGHVVQQHGDRILVEWFSWAMGEATYATWHSLDEAATQKWRFFESMDDARSYYDANVYRLTGRSP